MADPQRVGDAIVRKLVTFGRILREAGLEVGPGRLQDGLRALDSVRLDDRDEVYHALRCAIVSRRDDLEAFDAAFATFWERAPGAALTHRPPIMQADAEPRRADAQQAGAASHGRGGDDEQLPLAAVYSADELLRERDFARFGPDELRRARALVERIATASPRRRSLRSRSSHDGRSIDLRRTLHQAMRTGGYPVERAWRTPKTVPRRLVFLVDVSGSMEPYARAMTMFLQAAVRSGRHVEAFTFGTRLTRLTPHLAGRDPDRALARAAAAVPDWAGGTRIGENLKAFNDVWGRRALTRGAVVVIASDGWERGDPALLGNEMARLRRAAHTVVWINPLAGGAGYRPLVAGMAAALPHVDLFLPGHNLKALEALADALDEIPARRHTGGTAA
ncbi:MAG: VWA domain-containing protein [Gaiellales bacterium]